MIPMVLLKAIYQIPSCIFFKDKKLRYRFASKRWNQLNNDNIIGKTDLEIRKDKENAQFATNIDKEILRTGEGISYTIKSDIDGEVTYLEILKEPVFNMFGKIIGIAGLINDVTDKVLLNQEFEKLSSTDYLTGAMNRKMGTLKINEKLEDFSTSKMFCLLDIDNFKRYNDKYGHQAGDIILQEVSKLLLNISFNNDVVMRLGGDEFVIFLNNVEINTLNIFIKKLFDGIKSIRIPKINEELSISIGITPVKKGDTFDVLYSQADRNMYKAKNVEGNYYVYG